MSVTTVAGRSQSRGEDEGRSNEVKLKPYVIGMAKIVATCLAHGMGYGSLILSCFIMHLVITVLTFAGPAPLAQSSALRHGVHVVTSREVVCGFAGSCGRNDGSAKGRRTTLP